MDAFIAIGGAFMGKDCWKEGRNLVRMGLDGLDPEQLLVYLEKGEQPL